MQTKRANAWRTQGLRFRELWGVESQRLHRLRSCRQVCAYPAQSTLRMRALLRLWLNTTRFASLPDGLQDRKIRRDPTTASAPPALWLWVVACCRQGCVLPAAALRSWDDALQALTTDCTCRLHHWPWGKVAYGREDLCSRPAPPGGSSHFKLYL